MTVILMIVTLVMGSGNHESDVKAIFGFSKEDFRPSHSSHHHIMLPEDDEFFEEIVFSRVRQLCTKCMVLIIPG